MTARTELEKRKKRTENTDIKTSESQVSIPFTPYKDLANNLIADQVFCAECKTYHSKGLKGRLLCHIRRLFA